MVSTLCLIKGNILKVGLMEIKNKLVHEPHQANLCLRAFRHDKF